MLCNLFIVSKCNNVLLHKNLPAVASTSGGFGDGIARFEMGRYFSCQKMIVYAILHANANMHYISQQFE